MPFQAFVGHDKGLRKAFVFTLHADGPRIMPGMSLVTITSERFDPGPQT